MNRFDRERLEQSKRLVEIAKRERAELERILEQSMCSIRRSLALLERLEAGSEKPQG